MVIHKYIIHVLDRNSEGPILNDFEGKNNAEVDKFFQKIINRAAKDDDLRKAVFKDYNENNIVLIIEEMVDVLCTKMRKYNKQCTVIGLGIGYSQDIGGGFYHSIKLDNPSDSNKDILKVCLLIFERYYEQMPIRKVTISCGNIVEKTGVQLNLFNPIQNINNDNLEKLIN